MNIGRIIGAILVLFGCIYSFFFVIGKHLFPFAPAYTIFIVVSFIVTIVSTIGGIFLILNKKIGGILAIIAGCTILTGALLSLVPPLSAGYLFILYDPFMIDALPMIVGGIIGLVVKKD